MVSDKPYKPLLLFLPFYILASVFLQRSTIDLQFHDTYFVINAMDVGIVYSLILGISGILYWLLRKKRMNNWMTSIQVISIISIAIIMLISIYLSTHYRMINNIENYQKFMFLWKVILVFTLLNLLLLLLLLNLTTGLIRNKLR